MDSKKIQATTLVSPSHPTSWSQAYSAGNLFAVVSLTQPEKSQEADILAIVGKEILNTLEAEYFTLETKDLESIQNAVNVAIKHAIEKENIGSFSACFATVIENVLYIFAIGGAKIYVKRQDKLGLLLSRQEPTLASASGFLQTNDLVILQTKSFEEVVSKEKLVQAIEHKHPTEIAANLSSIVQEYEKGGAAAVVFLYTEPQKNTQEKETEENQEILIQESKTLLQKQTFRMPMLEKIIQALLLLATTYRVHIKPRQTWVSLGLPVLKLPHIELSRKRKIFLSIGVLLALLLFFGVIYTTKQKEATKQQTLFEKVYASAQKKFDEGQSLTGLNKNLSRDNLTQAQKLIIDNKDKFSNNKVLKEKLDALLKNVEDGLLAVRGVNRVDAKPTGENASTMLSMALENNSIAVTQDEKTIYTIDNKAITSVDKKTKNKKTLVSNKDSWKTIGGLGSYIGNIYVLDKDQGQIFKFVDSNQNNYFNSKQDLSKTTGIAIDGSIWVLYSDGAIQKWTRGKQDSFTISGLDEQLKNPTRIFTDTETSNLYILDNGNARIVVIKKNGMYETQYQTDILKSAKEFDVLEKEKKIFVLSGQKVWQINLSSN